LLYWKKVLSVKLLEEFVLVASPEEGSSGRTKDSSGEATKRRFFRYNKTFYRKKE